MGTINYGTSDYITLGAKPESRFEWEQDKALMEELKDLAKEHGNTIDEEIEEQLWINMESDLDNARYELEKHSFYHFNVAIKYGYYEGFYIDIENNFPLFFDDYEEKKEALAEIREIEQYLKDNAGNGLVSVYPGWCTSYADYKQTLKDIRTAAREMREDVKNTPTWRTYKEK